MGIIHILKNVKIKIRRNTQNILILIIFSNIILKGSKIRQKDECYTSFNSAYKQEYYYQKIQVLGNPAQKQQGSAVFLMPPYVITWDNNRYILFWLQLQFNLEHQVVWGLGVEDTLEADLVSGLCLLSPIFLDLVKMSLKAPFTKTLKTQNYFTILFRFLIFRLAFCGHRVYFRVILVIFSICSDKLVHNFCTLQ
eukprot:TRINITY_DN11467_c0_g1_i4.p1 TRINITY_DN11467_c0_g1~~TRINITY_DN11467_c0_g1_i4.p1  ORF type:complete len:195 (+),score=-4.85 TRINITY_DN11467_c0_g1_i4:403-987(+)